MKKNWTIGKRIYSLAGFLVLVITGVGLFAILSINRLQSISQRISEDNMPGLAYSAELNRSLAEAQIRVLRMLRAHTPESRKAIRDEISTIAASISDSMQKYEKTINVEEDRKLFEVLKQCREGYLKARDEYFKVIETSQDAALQMADGDVKSSYTAYDKAGKDLMEFNQKMGHMNSTELDRTVQTVRWMLLISGFLSVIAGIGASVYMARNTKVILKGVVSAVSTGAEQIAMASGQVSSSSQSLAEGAGEQAASLEETSSSLEEMSSMTQRNAENALAAKENASQARRVADVGSGQMQTLLGAMNSIKESSEDITKILKTIDEIAFQTNLLALNAAVEAARAGEAGMGFAVVADEVRSLAQRCATAAKETAVKIEDSVNKSRQGAQISADVARSFEDIQNRVRRLDELLAEISTASKEQSQGIVQINTAVAEMDKITQNNAANAEESASASEELSSQAETLRDVVGELQRLVDDSQANHPAATRPAPLLNNAMNGNGHIQKKPLKSALLKKKNGNVPRFNGTPKAIATPRPESFNSAPSENGDFSDF